MYPLIPPTTGLEGGLQLTVKYEGGPELENVITTGPGAEGMTVQIQKKQNLPRAYSIITLITNRVGQFYNCTGHLLMMAQVDQCHVITIKLVLFT